MIQFSHTYKIFPNGHQGLRDVSFRIEEGEFVFLSGPSGAGKTTIFRLISAFDRASSGEVEVFGDAVSSLPASLIPHFRRKIGVVYQDFRLLRDRTILENVGLPLVVRGEAHTQVEASARRVLDKVGLSDRYDAYPDELSGGEQQRVAVARALIHQPKILIADEPTGNLDAHMSNEIFRLLEHVNQSGTTVFVATHDADAIRKRHHRVVRISDGQVEAE